ncbi:MAG: hypothetical protein L7F78_01510 [Syntrophales bacterium LBB04]|nr:hypothetical protein [Syntrophales bacterium LBB04]
MTNEKKTGSLLILIGVLIPLLTIPFLSGYAKDKGIFENLYRLGIELRKTSNDRPEGRTQERIDNTTGKATGFTKLMPKRIPLRLFLVITVILLYMGIVRLAAPPRQDDGTEEEE